MTTMFTYRRRWVDARGVISVHGFRMKRYELRCAQKESLVALTDAEWQEALRVWLPTRKDEFEHRIGFAILHYARDGDYLLTSRWYGGNMLKHEAFTFNCYSGDVHCESLAESRVTACVWELAVIAFERDAWVRTAMAHEGRSPSFDDYLRVTFRGWV